jgi:HD-GYP domain-containing protein (c-di-GMP phosphodiesterase class II)
MDGAGFPDGLQGDGIPREARIVAVVDAFDAMTTNRAYRPSRVFPDAVDELHRCAGTHFDPEVVRAFTGAFPDFGTPAD